MIRTCRHLLISGRVQGVCFRHYTRQEALKNGVHGWVKNLPDGRVEALLEGPKTAVAATIAWCQQGPEAAQVDRVDIEDPKRDEKFTSFTIR
ncbi:MAG: acylphosphatase [Geopsychrobacter sp.]|nr:acylphosphatase [Geopsychrobacter sp.]